MAFSDVHRPREELVDGQEDSSSVEGIPLWVRLGQDRREVSVKANRRLKRTILEEDALRAFFRTF